MKNAEKSHQQLIAENQRLRSLIDVTTDAMFCYEYIPPIPISLPFDEQVEQLYRGVLVDCNMACAKSFGASSLEEVIGRKLTDLFGTRPGSLDRLFNSLIDGGYRIIDGEGIENLPDGTQRCFLKNVHVVIEDDTLLRICGTYRDITDRIQAENDQKRLLDENSSCVTNQTLAEQEQYKSEEKYRLLVENVPSVVWATDEYGKTTYISPNIERIYGFTQQEIYNSGVEVWLNRIHADDLDIVGKAFSALIESGTPFDVEYRIQRKDGEWLWLRDQADTVKMKKGKRYAYGVFVDITNRKKAENKLRESETFIQKSLDAQVDTFFVFDPRTGKAVRWNRAFEESSGYSSAEIAELKAPDSYYSKEDLLKAASTTQTINEQGVATVEMELITKDGRRIPTEYRASPVLNPQGNLTHIISVGRDISERKQAEEALRESERSLKSLVEGLQTAIVVHDGNGKIIMSNQMAKRFLEPLVGDIEGRELGDPGWRFFYEDGEEAPIDELPASRILKTQEAINDLLLGYRVPDGSEMFWFLVNGIPTIDNDGHLSKVIVSFVDITERKRAEEQREKLQSQLTQAQKMESVGRLAGGVAHDFNNMLGVILGYAETILDEVESQQPLYDSAKQIVKAAERSADLTRQLLAFARKQTVALEVLDLNKTVSGMLEMLHRIIGEDIDLAWRPGKELGPIRMDKSQIDQILANLCVNARDAIADVGKITIETDNATFDEEYCVHQPGFTPGEYVLLTVSDDGHGMDKETQANLFEPFFTTKAVGEGTGLGLATVYGIVKQNEGFINVYSELGSGTSFRIYLPRHMSKAEHTIKTADFAKSVEGGKEIILLVEDESSILELTTIILEKQGYAVMAARTPGEAVRLARECSGRIDLLMTDVVMPEMNGRDLAKNLMSFYPDIKRLFMSGYTANVIAHHGVLDKGVNFIQKPFRKKDLMAKVREVLDQV